MFNKFLSIGFTSTQNIPNLKLLLQSGVCLNRRPETQDSCAAVLNFLNINNQNFVMLSWSTIFKTCAFPWLITLKRYILFVSFSSFLISKVNLIDFRYVNLQNKTNLESSGLTIIVFFFQRFLFFCFLEENLQTN